MFDVETLLRVGLPNHLVSVWEVFFYIALMVPCLLLQRTKLSLLLTYLFTYYLAFQIYWGDRIQETGSMVPFVIYVVSGLAIVVLFVVAAFTERTSRSVSPSS